MHKKLQIFKVEEISIHVSKDANYQLCRGAETLNAGYDDLQGIHSAAQGSYREADGSQGPKTKVPKEIQAKLNQSALDANPINKMGKEFWLLCSALFLLTIA